MSTFEVTPSDLTGAGATLQRAGNDLATVGVRSMRGTGTDDLGSPELEQAVTELCDSGFVVVVALWNAVEQTGANLAAAAAAYAIADALSMRVGGR